MDHKAVIIGKDHHNALGIVESLGRKGIRPYLVVLTRYKKSFVGNSKFVEKCWCCADHDAVVRVLCENFTDRQNKAVAYACDDETAVLLDENHTILEPILFLPTVNPAGALSDWMQKERMSKLAEEVGMLIPKTWVIEGESLPDDIIYPVITKAHSSIEGGKDNLHVCQNKDELENMLKGNHCSTMILQEYISKAFEYQLIGYSGERGAIIIPGRTNIVRPKGIDNTFFLSYDKCESSFDTLIEKAKLFIKKTGYTGTFSMEFLYDSKGESYFTEMNFRNDGNAICVTEFGVNLPYIMYLEKTGQNITEEVNPKETKKVWLYPELYFMNVITGEIGILELFRNLCKANCYTLYFKDDKKPTWKFFEYAIRKRIKLL